nr:MAG TPA: hypothetical protein [Bacteriophage sp.]
MNRTYGSGLEPEHSGLSHSLERRIAYEVM